MAYLRRWGWKKSQRRGVCLTGSQELWGWGAPQGGSEDGAGADSTKERVLCSAEEGVSTNKTAGPELEKAAP